MGMKCEAFELMNDASNALVVPPPAVENDPTPASPPVVKFVEPNTPHTWFVCVAP